MGLKLNGTNQLLVYADDVNLLGDKTSAKNNKKQILTDATKEVGPKANAEKTKYVLLSRHQTAGQNHKIRMANRSFENMAKLKSFGTTEGNQNLIQEEIKRRLNSGNALYHSAPYICFLVCCQET
jgi:hypothetical protein